MTQIKNLIFDQDELTCPNCESHYIHHYRTCVYERFSEDADGCSTTVENLTVTTKPCPAGRHLGRRDSIVIDFFCEECDASLALVLKQHKGSTLIEWIVDPEKMPEYKRTLFCEDPSGGVHG